MCYFTSNFNILRSIPTYRSRRRQCPTGCDRQTSMMQSVIVFLHQNAAPIIVFSPYRRWLLANTTSDWILSFGRKVCTSRCSTRHRTQASATHHAPRAPTCRSVPRSSPPVDGSQAATAEWTRAAAEGTTAPTADAQPAALTRACRTRAGASASASGLQLSEWPQVMDRVLANQRTKE